MCLKSFILVLCSAAVTLDLHHHLGKCVSVCRFASPATFTAADFVLLSLVFNLTSNLHSNLANEFKVSSYSFWKDFSPRDTDCSDSRAFLSDPFFCIFPSLSFSSLIWNFMKTSSRESPYSVGFWVYFRWSNLSLNTQEPFKFCFLSFIISSPWYRSEITF